MYYLPRDFHSRDFFPMAAGIILGPIRLKHLEMSYKINVLSERMKTQIGIS